MPSGTNYENGRSEQMNETQKLKSIEPKWHRQGVWICRDCELDLDVSPATSEPNASPALALRKWLKLQLALRFRWGKTRVMTTSCMDICPKGKMLVSVTTEIPGKTQSFAIDPSADRDVLLEKILSQDV